MMQQPIAYHGLAAYSGSRHSPLRMYRHGLAVQQLEGTADLCVADRAIGPVGLIVSGHLSAVYDADVWSVVEHDGSRRTTAKYWEGRLNVATHSDWVRWSDSHADETRYCEGWMIDPVVCGVWVKPHATRAQLAAADSLCRRFGLAVSRIVTRDMRIGELYPVADETSANDDFFALWDRLAG